MATAVGDGSWRVALVVSVVSVGIALLTTAMVLIVSPEVARDAALRDLTQALRKLQEGSAVVAAHDARRGHRLQRSSRPTEQELEQVRARFEWLRVEADAARMGGAPTIRGLRVPVATVVAMVADGMTPQEICAELPGVTVEDVSAALAFAAVRVSEPAPALPLQ